MSFLKPTNNAPEMVRYQHCKGVSDLEMCMDYFSLQGKNCENLSFCFPTYSKVCSKHPLLLNDLLLLPFVEFFHH